MLGHSARETLCAPSKSGVSFSPSPEDLLPSSPVDLQAKCSGGSSTQCQTLRLSWRANFLWECPFVACMDLIFFGVRVVFSIDVCHLFPPCMLAIIPSDRRCD